MDGVRRGAEPAARPGRIDTTRLLPFGPQVAVEPRGAPAAGPPRVAEGVARVVVAAGAAYGALSRRESAARVGTSVPARCRAT